MGSGVSVDSAVGVAHNCCSVLRFYYMVGEPYHGGDFMTLTQRAKEQQVPMTEAPCHG